MRLPILRPLLLALLAFLVQLPAWAGVNVNTASAAELESLPGIGPAKAAAIIRYRDEHGAFTSVDQLDDVPGIGPATLANLRDLVEVGDGATTAPPSAGSPDPAPAADAIDVNSASAARLQELPGIGPAKARAIVADRDANGPFASCADLQRVQGIGKATVAGLADRCVAR